MSTSDDATEEAKAFDARVLERFNHGMRADLRHAQAVDWFYNNPWRRPEFVDMVFGEYLRFAVRHLPPQPAKILEVGCGTGHMSLELARSGYEVTGLDVSQASLEIARQTAEAAPRPSGFGTLEYVRGDAMSWHSKDPMHAVCIFLSLHHFADPGALLDHLMRMMTAPGRIVVIEPARDWLTRLDAAVAVLIRTLLSAYGGWHEDLFLPQNEGQFQRSVEECLLEYQDATDTSEEPQSPRDNSTFASAMLEALDERFERVALETRFALVPRMVGGIRATSDEKALSIAKFVAVFDEFCVTRGLLQPGVFCYAGELPSGEHEAIR